jgi:hypothetical protein
MVRKIKLEIKKGKGGSRAGSGRKKTGLKTITLRMSPDLHQQIKTKADRYGITISEYVTRTLQENPILHPTDDEILQKMKDVLKHQTQGVILIKSLLQHRH